MTSEASKLAKEILVDVESSASSYKQLKEENEKLKARNEEMKEERDKVITFSELTIKEIKQKYQEKIDDTADLAKELQNGYKEQIKEIDELKEKNKILKNKNDKLEIMGLALAKELQNDYKKHIKGIEELKEKNKTLRVENDKLKNRKMYKNLRADIEKQVQEHKTEIERYDKSRDAWMTTCDELRSEIGELKKMLDGLPNDMEDKWWDKNNSRWRWDGDGFKEECEEDEDSCECMECKNEFISDEMFAIVDPENEEQTKFMCQDCMKGSDYQNICSDCGNNYYFEDGITKNDGESYFDYCMYCYNDDKEALDKKYGKEEE